MDRSRIVGYLAALTDDEFRSVTGEARGSDPANVRASIAEKAAAMAATPRDHNGSLVAGIADIAAARAPQAPPEPVEPPPPQPDSASIALRGPQVVAAHHQNRSVRETQG
jgi:hypothetical protein